MEIPDLINKYWQIIIAIVGIIGMWVKMQITDKDHETRIRSIESDFKAFNPTLLQIQKDIVEIKTTLKIHFKNEQ